MFQLGNDSHFSCANVAVLQQGYADGKRMSSPTRIPLMHLPLLSRTISNGQALRCLMWRQGNGNAAAQRNLQIRLAVSAILIHLESEAVHETSDETTILRFVPHCSVMSKM